MPSRVVSVGEFATGVEASLAQGMLEDEGIEATLTGEIGQAWAIGMGPLTQSVRLEVRVEDAERAQELIRQIEGRIRERLEREEDASDRAVRRPAGGAEDELDTDMQTESEPELEDEDVPPLSRIDVSARRAWLASVFALAFPLLLVASIPALLPLLKPEADSALSAAGRRWRRYAILLTCFGPPVWAILAVWFFGRAERGW